jgi:hypothetical protein
MSGDQLYGVPLRLKSLFGDQVYQVHFEVYMSPSVGRVAESV